MYIYLINLKYWLYSQHKENGEDTITVTEAATAALLTAGDTSALEIKLTLVKKDYTIKMTMMKNTDFFDINPPLHDKKSLVEMDYFPPYPSHHNYHYWLYWRGYVYRGTTTATHDGKYNDDDDENHNSKNDEEEVEEETTTLEGNWCSLSFCIWSSRVIITSDHHDFLWLQWRGR